MRRLRSWQDGCSARETGRTARVARRNGTQLWVSHGRMVEIRGGVLTDIIVLLNETVALNTQTFPPEKDNLTIICEIQMGRDDHCHKRFIIAHVACWSTFKTLTICPKYLDAVMKDHNDLLNLSKRYRSFNQRQPRHALDVLLLHELTHALPDGEAPRDIDAINSYGWRNARRLSDWERVVGNAGTQSPLGARDISDVLTLLQIHWHFSQQGPIS